MGQPVAVDAEVKRWRDEALGLRRRVKVLERANGELVAANRDLRGRLERLQGQVDGLTRQLQVLSELAFGGRSEKLTKAGTAAGQAPAGQAGQQGVGRQRRRRGQQPGSRGHGRRDYSGLPTVEVIGQVDQAQRVCPRCGKAYAPHGQQTTELLDWQVVACRMLVRRPRLRRVCSCPVAGMLVAPPPERPIPKSRFTAQFVARLLTEKFVGGRPLSRIAMALSHDGLQVAQGTLVGVLDKTSGLLGPLEQQIWARNATAAHLHADETGWKVFEQVAGKHSHRWWCWVFVAADTTVFRIQPSRSTAVLADHLGIDLDAEALQPGRQLLVSSDFYRVYQQVARLEGVQPLWCWAHLRRYFIRAANTHPELAAWAAEWLERIAALYGAHHAVAATAANTPACSDALAAMDAALQAIDVARHQQSADPQLPSPAAEVLATLERQWDGLARHLNHPELPLDNNPAERALRGPVVGRKNYYGAGSITSARLAAQVWTITATTRQAGINPLAYLTAYLEACGTAGGRAPTGQALARFLPWQASSQDLAAWRNGDVPAP
jgi:transposase